MLRRDREEISFWPALADFVLAILLLVLLLWVADAGMRVVGDVNNPRLKADEIAVSVAEWNVLNKDRTATKEQLLRRVELKPSEQVIEKSELERMIRELKRRPLIRDGMEVVATTELEGFKRRMKELEDELRKRPDKPLVFPLEEASGFAFAPGKAELPVEFTANLRDVIIPKIRGIVGEFSIDVMEVIGHTDGQPVGQRSNVDSRLNAFVLESGAAGIIQTLKSGSNADLGLTRALSVAAFMQAEFARSGDAKLSRLFCRAYSGAQIISPTTNMIAGATDLDDPARRRIELRFTRNPKPPNP